MGKLIDVHVHLCALPMRDNGCRLSQRMRRTQVFKRVVAGQGLPVDEPAKANRLYLDKLKAELFDSEKVGRAVILGLDGAYDESGKMDEARTDMLISNDYVFAAASSAAGMFLPGASINPQRADALDELERCAEQGAVLVKFLANVQRFDPADRRYQPFYRALAKRQLPLLSHVGFEFSLIGHDQSAGDADRLLLALEEGVTVIAAHGCSTGLFFWEKHWPTMLRLISRFPNFYADVSALTLPNRVGELLRIRRHPEIFNRLLFGTDYPMPVFSYPCLLAGSGKGYRAAQAAKNRFDRQYGVLEALGIRLTTNFTDIKKC